jgi:hypothetical protein
MPASQPVVKHIQAKNSNVLNQQSHKAGRDSMHAQMDKGQLQSRGAPAEADSLNQNGSKNSTAAAAQQVQSSEAKGAGGASRAPPMQGSDQKRTNPESTISTPMQPFGRGAPAHPAPKIQPTRGGGRGVAGGRHQKIAEQNASASPDSLGNGSMGHQQQMNNRPLITPGSGAVDKKKDSLVPQQPNNNNAERADGSRPDTYQGSEQNANLSLPVCLSNILGTLSNKAAYDADIERELPEKYRSQDWRSILRVGTLVSSQHTHSENLDLCIPSAAYTAMMMPPHLKSSIFACRVGDG